jgi:hypothetical protein
MPAMWTEREALSMKKREMGLRQVEVCHSRCSDGLSATEARVTDIHAIYPLSGTP